MTLEIRSLEVSAADGKKLFEIESATIGKGLTAVVGSNGVGKSTWLRTLVGLEPMRGSVTLEGIDAQMRRRDYLGNVAYQPQNFAAYPEMDGREFLTYFLQLRGLDRKTAVKRAMAWLDLVGLGNRWERCSLYSQGMLQRLGLAYALQSEAALCVLDEPFAGVDPEAREQLSDLLAEEARHRIVLICTHHVEDMINRGASIAEIKGGKFALSGN